MCAFCFRTLNFDRFCFVANVLGSFDVMCEMCINAAEGGIRIGIRGSINSDVCGNTGIT